MSEFRSADDYPVMAGAKFWDNDLRVVEITEVNVSNYPYSDTGEIQTWHETTNGIFLYLSDTLSGTMQPYGRLARYFEGKDAEAYPADTNYHDVKGK